MSVVTDRFTKDIRVGQARELAHGDVDKSGTHPSAQHMQKELRNHREMIKYPSMLWAPHRYEGSWVESLCVPAQFLTYP